jgi:hypothetical protein
MLGRRQVLTASAALPAVLVTLAATGCEPLDAALGKTPPLSRDVLTLQAAITAEQDLIDLYNRTMASYSVLSPALTPLLAEHREHLARMRARISYPSGYTASPSPSPRATSAAGSHAAAIAAVRDAESAAAAAQLTRLAAVSPSIAQLLASISTSESTHVAALAGVS